MYSVRLRFSSTAVHLYYVQSRRYKTNNKKISQMNYHANPKSNIFDEIDKSYLLLKKKNNYGFFFY